MKTLLAWSSGKDSAWSACQLRQQPGVELAGLLTLLSSHDRVFMHAVRPEILAAQADAMELPIFEVRLPPAASDAEYESALLAELRRAKDQGFEAVAYGDLFLEDVRTHREEILAKVGLRGLFPLWKLETRMLARTMLEHGIEAYVTCVDLSKLTEPFVGRRWDSKFLHDLPASADPCGEYGEFHTVVLGGPMFRCRIDAHVGDRFLSKGFAFADVRLKLKSVSP